jgi:hypothetical protein
MFVLSVFLFLWIAVICQVSFGTVTSVASVTYYSSYPFCCPKSPNYDPNAPTEECDDYSGCKYMGDFAAIGHKSLQYVQT